MPNPVADQTGETDPKYVEFMQAFHAKLYTEIHDRLTAQNLSEGEWKQVNDIYEVDPDSGYTGYGMDLLVDTESTGSIYRAYRSQGKFAADKITECIKVQTERKHTIFTYLDMEPDDGNYVHIKVWVYTRRDEQQNSLENPQTDIVDN